MYHVVKYSGPFGFIKPWTAVRDIETFSQQFLTPSIVEGIEKKLFPELLEKPGIYKIRRHRLTYIGLSHQQEQTQPRGIKQKPEKITKKTKAVEFSRSRSILTRVVLIEPSLFLCFDNEADAKNAGTQHICLCRNEDILLPDDQVIKVSKEQFEKDYNGFELRFEENDNSFIVGYNRFNNGTPMFGWINIVGENPLKTNSL
jgi:hypothetical protein